MLLNIPTWDTQETYYKGLNKVNKLKLLILRRDFEYLSMKDRKLVESFYT